MTAQYLVINLAWDNEVKIFESKSELDSYINDEIKFYVNDNGETIENAVEEVLDNLSIYSADNIAKCEFELKIPTQFVEILIQRKEN